VWVSIGFIDLGELVMRVGGGGHKLGSISRRCYFSCRESALVGESVLLAKRAFL
jgi:hypothetical protein